MRSPDPFSNDARFRLLGFSALVAALVFASPWVTSAGATDGSAAPAASHAELKDESPSPAVRQMADWVAAYTTTAMPSSSSRLSCDEKTATVYVFDAAATLTGSTPVLLGAATGDDSVPGIGERPIADVRPEERTTPAGRFIAERGRNAQGEDVVWVDYDAAVSMHRVRANNPKERRLERLATPTADDNRISYGCINVPAAFYDAQIRPIFAKHVAVVYVLPEVKSLHQVFGPSWVAVTAAEASTRR